jgi:hypothetical protein
MSLTWSNEFSRGSLNKDGVTHQLNEKPNVGFEINEGLYYKPELGRHTLDGEEMTSEERSLSAAFISAFAPPAPKDAEVTPPPAEGAGEAGMIMGATDDVSIAMQFLRRTDWYVTREQEKGDVTPPDILKRRQYCRDIVSNAVASGDAPASIIDAMQRKIKEQCVQDVTDEEWFANWSAVVKREVPLF